MAPSVRRYLGAGRYYNNGDEQRSNITDVLNKTKLGDSLDTGIKMITSSQIKTFRNESIDYTETVLIKDELVQLRRKRSPFYLTKEELDKILHWKLRGQYGRLNHLLSANSDELIRKVTGLALSVEHPDADYELELRFKILTCLRGVGVPVASAIMALVYPEKYAVIDFHGWRQIFSENKSTFTIGDYKRYLVEIRRLAEELDWPIHDVDLAIWEYDRSLSQGTTRKG